MCDRTEIGIAAPDRVEPGHGPMHDPISGEKPAILVRLGCEVRLVTLPGLALGVGQGRRKEGEAGQAVIGESMRPTGRATLEIGAGVVETNDLGLAGNDVTPLGGDRIRDGQPRRVLMRSS